LVIVASDLEVSNLKELLPVIRNPSVKCMPVEPKTSYLYRFGSAVLNFPVWKVCSNCLVYCFCFVFPYSILRNNSFYGIIPIEIGDLQDIKMLDLGYNNFRGPIPSELQNIVSLEFL